MIKQITLIYIINLLFLNNLFAYNLDNECEKLLANGEFNMAVEAAEKLKNQDDFGGSFCMGKALFNSNENLKAVTAFTEAESKAKHPSDQMLAMIFQGLALKDEKQYEKAHKVFNKGLETAKLGNSKFMQFERRFINQIGDINKLLGKHDMALENYTEGLKKSANDDERAESYEKLANNAADRKDYGQAVEFSLKSMLAYKKIGDLGQFAELSLLNAQYQKLDNNYAKAKESIFNLERFCIENGGDYYLVKVYLLMDTLLDPKDKNGIDYREKGRALATKLGASDLLN